MDETSIVESFFLIFAGAAVLATLALQGRQPLLLAYIAVGCILGPHGAALVTDADLLAEIAEIGIIFLLFLAGLDLAPGKLKEVAVKSALTVLASGIVFFALGFGLMTLFGYSRTEATVGGLASVLSSTILGLKLLPTTVLHHRRIGELVIGLLLMQDLVAIIALLFLSGRGAEDQLASAIALIAAALPLLAAAAWLGMRFVLLPLLRKFDVFREFIFLLALGWCLGFASLASMFGLSSAIGAFIAGVSLATSPIAMHIAESLRPLRDFFLVLFFFSIGSSIDPGLMREVALPAILLAILMVALKPGVFALLLRWQGEDSAAAWEVGCRLGQASEFSLLLSYAALASGLMGEGAAHVVQGATVLTLIASSYLVIFRYPCPIAVRAELRRD